MGTDIHGVFQRKTDDGKWENVPSNWEQERNYLLFAWLGDVRNGFGVAGIHTHSPLIPLSDCRGFPEDFWMDGDCHPWMGDHSYSWVSATEILNASPQRIIRTGVITLADYYEWDKKSNPYCYSAWVSGPRIQINTPESINFLTTHVQAEWEVDVLDELEYFISEVRRLTELYGEVRLVFGFDS